MTIRWIAALSLSALVAAPVALADSDEQEAMIAAGRAVFHKCEACHTLDPAKNGFGPNLHGVVGREAGTIPRFAYSDALKNSGITWTEDNLRKWVADNEALVPGTRMRHVSVTDPVEQDYLIAFLKSLK
ncbi:Cytochrome c2 [Marinobacterium lacunae]|uniref:Cytochrome c2 n=1 Tax=Marinobacterium lacunae TaxID=1232683 RepID=A0A081FXG8_9GAMM|nr:c-type cytochrome [Marinobacterium lacunae]KEA63223.1 Cytochrome c2 [Marinobacterium lacunae]MBR9882738.1 c-type cytochrome [Oceanospirillales bacterium]